MFGLLESCKLNKVNLGEYIEDILTRILCGEEVDASFLPCDYVRHFEDGTDAKVTANPLINSGNAVLVVYNSTFVSLETL